MTIYVKENVLISNDLTVNLIWHIADLPIQEFLSIITDINLVIKEAL
jgi:hypothetical protein